MPQYKVWYFKKLQASRTVEATGPQEAQEAGAAFEGEIQDGEAEITHGWKVSVAVPVEQG